MKGEHDAPGQVDTVDTSKLVEGQKVWMKSGDECAAGLVVEITEKYVAVKVPYAEENPWDYRVFPRFDRTGKQPEGDDPDFFIEGRTIDAFLVPYPLCGKSGKPWELTEVSVESRDRVTFDQQIRKYYQSSVKTGFEAGWFVIGLLAVTALFVVLAVLNHR